MTFKEQVNELLNAALESRPDLFLIECTISEDNHINILLDGDEGVNMLSCMEVSRHIEHNLDREVFDFSLAVGSAGVGSPLLNARQFIKNKGRTLRVEREGVRAVEGILQEADENAFTLEWKQREPKPVGKGKITVIKKETLLYQDILSAKVLVK
jgi:ribosome maturation factor RimP